MIFLVTAVIAQDDSKTCLWSLHRTEKGQPGEVLCRSVDSWPTERQARANINAFKRSIGGTTLRYASVRVNEIRPEPPDPSEPGAPGNDDDRYNVAWHGGEDQQDCQHCEGDQDACDGWECQV